MSQTTATLLGRASSIRLGLIVHQDGVLPQTLHKARKLQVWSVASMLGLCWLGKQPLFVAPSKYSFISDPDSSLILCRGFTYIPARDPIVSGACTKAVRTNPASYLSCSKGSVVQVTKTNVGESTAVTYEQVRSDGSTYNKTTTLLFTSVEIDAPTIQINHRPVDLSRNFSSPTTTAPPTTSVQGGATSHTATKGTITSSTTKLYPHVITVMLFATIISLVL